MAVIQKDISQIAVLEKSKIGEYEKIWKWEKSNSSFNKYALNIILCVISRLGDIDVNKTAAHKTKETKIPVLHYWIPYAFIIQSLTTSRV